MAVVQISKIQIRRGKKNEGTGMPQLAGGELAWAVDTQELFIGNGAVGEGAPYVGNTKVLTEHDSILDLVANYTYKYDSDLGQSSIPGVVTRSLQNRLDDGVVNAKNFGIKSLSELTSQEIIDGLTDQTTKIQTAINSLTDGPDVTLEFEPGEYYFSDTILLPSNVKIAGYGKNETIFSYTGTTEVLFSTEQDSNKIKLRDFTIRANANNRTYLEINNSKECEFVNVKFLHDDGNDGVPGNVANNRIGIRLIGNGMISYNRFAGLEFRNLTYGVYADSNASFNKFEGCLLEYLYQGFNFGVNSTTGANYNTVVNSIFDKITRQALVVQKGTGNRSRGNTYKDVGSTNSGTFSTYSVIRFVTDGNSSSQDIFERQKYLEPNDPNFNNNPYLPEIDGVAFKNKTEPRQILLPFTETEVMAFKIGIGNSSGVKIDYVFKSDAYSQMRKGTIHIAVDKLIDLVQLTDEYEYIGNSQAGQDALLFTANLESVNGVKILRVNYINNNIGDTNTFTYTYSILS